MRRYIKKEIIEIIHTLLQAIPQIQKLKLNGESSALQNLLADCQDAAVGIGNAVEEAEGEGTEAVAELTKYCELLYQLLIGDSCDTTVLEQSLEKVIEHIKSLPERLEVVFLPYKASMWDSLESVWMAAAEDEQCDAYVVPIPYFDKNADGTLGNMYYEGEQLPEYVPVVDWKNYDISKRKPDIIYFHNPYDQYNYVTSVHPAFYAAEIRKHTGKLIYCPYFVSSEKVAEHYCLLPGVLWADKVILQSELIRNQYIQHYNRSVTEPNMKALWGEAGGKFVALGSPKVDKVLFGKKEDMEIPIEWEELCREKKIVFFNTHLSETLSNGDTFLEKLKSVLEYFEKSDRYVLWWRPHPLTSQTINTLRPEFLQKYREIVREYQEKRYGIYDETPYWYRAVLWADVYYGSGGSLRPLFGITGKPVTDWEVSKPLDADGTGIQYEAYADVADKRFLLSGELGALVCMDKSTGEYSLEAVLPEQVQRVEFAFSKLFADGKKIYIFIPHVDAHFIYDREEHRFEEIKWHIHGERITSGVSCKVAEILSYKQYFIMIPHGLNAILTYNKENGKLSAYTDWIGQIRGKIRDINDLGIWFRMYSACIADDKIYAILRCNKNDVICSFSLPELRLEKISVLPVEEACICLEYDGKYFWMISYFSNELLRWDAEKNSIQRYENPTLTEASQRTRLLYRIAIAGGQVYLCPIEDNLPFLRVENEQMVVTEPIPELEDIGWLKHCLTRRTCPKECKSAEYKQQLMSILIKHTLNQPGKISIKETRWLQFYDWLDYLFICNKGWNAELAIGRYNELFYRSQQSAGLLIHEYVMNCLED